MCPVIERIENAGPGSRARRLIFDDGSEPRVTSKAALKELGIEVGATVDGDELEHMLADIELPLAKDRALRLLGYRDHAVAELESKLRNDGYPAEVARSVCMRFTEVQLLDDARFAATWARSRGNQGYGTRRIARELADKGIDADVAAAALAEAQEGTTEVERAVASLRGKHATDRAGREKLLRRLVARGFAFSDALQALDASADPPEQGTP